MTDSDVQKQQIPNDQSEAAPELMDLSLSPSQEHNSNYLASHNTHIHTRPKVTANRTLRENVTIQLYLEAKKKKGLESETNWLLNLSFNKYHLFICSD